jgi:hypothetical protein
MWHYALPGWRLAAAGNWESAQGRREALSELRDDMRHAEDEDEPHPMTLNP